MNGGRLLREGEGILMNANLIAIHGCREGRKDGVFDEPTGEFVLECQ